MATKNLVPRADSEGKLGLKQEGNDRRWSEVNAVSGSFSEIKIDKLENLQSQPLLAAADSSITIEYDAEGNLGPQYKISSTGGGSQVDADKIIEGDSSVEVVDTDTDSYIKFVIDNEEKWQINSQGHLIPSLVPDEVLDLGSSDRNIRNLYLSNSGLKFESSELLVNNNTKRLEYSYFSGVNDVLPLTKIVRLATTNNIDLTTETQIDGVDLADQDRVLVKNQTITSENGIYVYDSAASPVLTRAGDFNTSQSFTNTIVNVREGNLNSNNLYHSLVQSTNGESIIGTNSQNWVQINNEGISFNSLPSLPELENLDDADGFIFKDASDSSTKQTSLEKLKNYIFDAVSGDVTATSEGILSISLTNVPNASLANDFITFSDNTTSTNISLGGSLTISGTTNEIDVTNNAGTFTIGLPDNVTIPQNLTVTGNLSLNQTVDLSLSSQKITNLGSPQDNSDAATKSYVDTQVSSLVQGINIVFAVKAATTSGTSLSGFTYDVNTNDFTESDSSGALTLDDVILSNGDRVLIKDQTNAIQNGIYSVGGIGGASSAVTLTRAADMSVGDQVGGTFAYVLEGTDNADKGFVCISPSSSDTVGTHNLNFTQFSGTGQISAGEGLTSTTAGSGKQFSVNVDNSSIEINADGNLSVKAGGITSAMLAPGSIDSSKLSTIASANSVKIEALDINHDSAEELTTLADDDLFIVHDTSDLTDSAVKNIKTQNISKYVLGKISGDIAVTDVNNNTLTIANNAITAAKLSTNAITGHANNLDSTTVANDDLLLIYDTDATELKKITKEDLLSGTSASIDYADLNELDSAGNDDFIAFYSATQGQRKISVSNLVKSKHLLTIEEYSSSQTKSIAPNTHLILANADTKYTLTLSTTGAVTGDIIKISIDNDLNLTSAPQLRSRSVIINGDQYSPREISVKGIEFVYEGDHWVAMSLPSRGLAKRTFNTCNMHTSAFALDALASDPGLSEDGGDEGSNSNGAFLLSSAGTIEINLPSNQSIKDWGRNKTYISKKFVVAHRSTQNILFNTRDTSGNLTTDIFDFKSGSTIYKQNSVTFGNVKPSTTFVAVYVDDIGWVIERTSKDISLSDLSDVNWSPLDELSSKDTVLVSKMSSPGQIYGQKIDGNFMLTKDPSEAAGSRTAAVTRNVIADSAIGTNEIENNKVTFEKIEKADPYRILGTVNGNLTEGGNTENVSSVKVYTDFDTHEVDLSNNDITDNSSLATLSATRDFVTKSLGSLNLTKASEGANTYLIDDNNPTVELLAEDVGKNIEISFNGTIANAYDTFSATFSSRLALSSQNNADKTYRIYLPSIAGLSPGSIISISYARLSNKLTNGIYIMPAINDPKPGPDGGPSTYVETVPNAVFVLNANGRNNNYDNLNHNGINTTLESLNMTFELLYYTNFTGPDGTTDLDAYVWHRTS